MRKNFFQFLVVLLLSGQTYFSYASVAFLHYDVDKGLPESKIQSITQDSTGFVWLAGENSLIRFDGHQFKVYKNKTWENSILPGDKINTVYTDSQGVLWVGSDNGIAFYDFLKDQFIRPSQNWEGINITDFTEDKKGNIWMASDEGLAKFNRKTNQIIWFNKEGSTKTNGHNILPNQNIENICSQPNDEIWLSTYPNGLYKLNPETQKINTYSEIDNIKLDQLSITHLEFLDNKLFISTLFNGFFEFQPKQEKIENFILEDFIYAVHHFSIGKDSILWLATNSGLIEYNDQTHKHQRYTNIPIDPLSLDRTAVNFVYIDNANNLWTSSGIRGISYGINNVPFQHFMFSKETPYMLTQQEVTAISFDMVGNLWLGYESGLIERHNPFNQTKTKFQIPTKNKSGNSGSVFAILGDRQNRIWIGGWECGLQQLNADGTSFDFAIVKPDTIAHLLETADIRDILEDNDGNIWLSTQGIGLIRYNPSTRQAKLFQFDEKNVEASLSNNYTFNMCLDKNNDLWIATSYGLSRYNPTKDSFSNYFHEEENYKSLSSNKVQTVYCDSAGLIWAGTNNGLNVYLEKQQIFQAISTEYDYSFQNISSIESVKPGEIWVSTNSGLVSINYSWDDNHEKLNYHLKYYNRSDGLISTNYFERSSTSSYDGLIFFGGNEGVDYLNPNDIRSTNNLPHTIITDISVYGQTVHPHIDPKDKDIPVLELEYNQQLISFRFTSLNFGNPEKQKYRYRLIGFNQQWIYPQNEQVATFTSLNPGIYHFQVDTKAGNGQWTEQPTTIKLKINPPFWLTLPFLVLAVILLLSVSFIAQRLRTQKHLKRQIALKSIIAERTNELMEKNQELETANLTKNKFFSIISHDLRSPFSGLIGILTLLNDPENPDIETRKSLLESASRTATNIYNLLENLLLWANSQLEELSYNPTAVNISEILGNNIELKHNQAIQKDIQLTADFADNLIAYCDSNMINTVVRNIISNAIKFTHPGGGINIGAEEQDNEIIIHIADTGIGLSPKQTQNLFGLTKTSQNGTNGEKGTGLGLLICKEFISRNHGEIWTTKNQPQGAIFHISLRKNQPNQK